jgi:spore coat polysaccharide biosynthesis protein SpsF (cytidylyltransferase family)
LFVDIFIPARLDSKRLPKKHLKLINGIPVIKILIDRLKNAKKIRHVIVCTTTCESDDPLIEFLEKTNTMYFRGNEKDILDRMLKAAKKFETDIIIDVEGDKIYMEPNYIDEIISRFEKSEADFIMGQENEFNASETIHGIIPSGIRVSTLEKICKIKNTNNTETGYMEFFTKYDFCKCEYIFPELKSEIPKSLKLTLDYPEDLEFADQIFSKLGNNPKFEDILELVKKSPEILKILESINEKWKKYYEQNIN